MTAFFWKNVQRKLPPKLCAVLAACSLYHGSSTRPYDVKNRCGHKSIWRDSMNRKKIKHYISNQNTRMACSHIFPMTMNFPKWGHIMIVGLKQDNPYKNSGGNKKLPPPTFVTVGIVQLFHQATTPPPKKTSSPWWAIHLLFGVDSMNRPNLTCGRPSAGVGRGCCCWVLYESIN